jgi:hypothetical protein
MDARDGLQQEVNSLPGRGGGEEQLLRPQPIWRTSSRELRGGRGTKKLWMTSIESSKSNTRWVSRFRDSDTVVTASELIRACLMAGA